jgi:hypothetical protein
MATRQDSAGPRSQKVIKLSKMINHVWKAVEFSSGEKRSKCVVPDSLLFFDNQKGA